MRQNRKDWQTNYLEITLMANETYFVKEALMILISITDIHTVYERNKNEVQTESLMKEIKYVSTDMCMLSDLEQELCNITNSLKNRYTTKQEGKKVQNAKIKKAM